MPDLYLDEEKLDFEDPGQKSTIGDLVATVEKELVELRRFVMEVWVDGEKLGDWRVSPMLKSPVSVHGDFRLITASVETVALEGVDMVQEYIKVIKESISACVQESRARGSGQSHFTNIFEGLIDVVKTMDALTRGGGRYGIDLFRENPANYYKHLLKYLDILSDAKGSGDTVLLADVLEYELKPVLEEMEEKIFYRYVA